METFSKMLTREKGALILSQLRIVSILLTTTRNELKAQSDDEEKPKKLRSI